ncbi:MAG: PrkA family serine protein kinase [Neptunomonas phycophila]|uniref:PrkA family serine protein kinase n=1 Tax=Neptunomonas phycophila TaxID=1572645 RepID=UPI003B8E671C
MSLQDKFKQRFENAKSEPMDLAAFLELCKKDPTVYSTAPERMLRAIGEPDVIDTTKDPRLSRIFQNRKIKVYPAFKEFFGAEEAIESIVSYYKHAAQGLEEAKQILYLLGPVGGGKSSLAETLKKLMTKEAIYVLCDKDGEMCPNFESPLGLFDPSEDAEELQSEFGIPKRYLTGIHGPWVQKRLREYQGDIFQFKVVKVMPSVLEQIAVSKTEPGDENNQDISALVGKTDIRKLKQFAQNDADAYSFSGGLCRANQGVMEFVEMFKAPIKVLHPLLTATQEGNFMGTEEGLPAIPFNGTILAHSNESEWQTFSTNKNNEAFLDRVYIVRVPYCLRFEDEVEIYNKLLNNSELAGKICAPYTLSMLAQFIVASRLKEPENSGLYGKLRVYNGDNVKDEKLDAKPIDEYRQLAGRDEGMSGLSTRYAFKVLSKVFNFDDEEVAANPIHLMYVLEQGIDNGDFDETTKERLRAFLRGTIQENYKEMIGREIQTAYMESYSEYGQNLFERYVEYADHWIEDNEYRDPDTGQAWDRNALNEELEKIEKPAGISNPKDFRHEVVKHVMRHGMNNNGQKPKWNEYKRIKEVIEEKMFTATEELLPVISFGAKSNSEDQSKHDEFVERMTKQGYTKRQVRLLVEWYARVRKA